MATKTISITEQAYARLASEKRAGESFTDVVLRLTGQRSLAQLADVVTPREANALAEAVLAGREDRAARRAERLGETP